MPDESGPTDDEMGLSPQDREVEAPKEMPTQLTEVEPIKESFTSIKEKGDLREVVEPPLLTAWEELYDRNIRTTSTSANKDDVRRGFAYIDIDYDTLSQANKEIGKRIGEVERGKNNISILRLKMPIDQSDLTTADVQQQAEEIATKFSKQPLTWGSLTIAEAREEYGLARDDESYGPESFTVMGFIYDAVSEILYRSEELQRKAMEPVE